MLLHLISLMILFEKGLANQDQLKTAILLYQEQQMRPCTLITILGQNQQELMVENQKKWSNTMKMLLDDSEFQFLTWNIETFPLNNSFAEDKRNFIFSTGCTIFITEENVVRSTSVTKSSMKKCQILIRYSKNELDVLWRHYTLIFKIFFSI